MKLDGMMEHYNCPRQRLPKVFWQNGYLDITRARTIAELGGMNGRKILPLVIEEEIVEIDYEDAFPRAEELLKRVQEGKVCKTDLEGRYPS